LGLLQTYFPFVVNERAVDIHIIFVHLRVDVCCHQR
jgi:hypothetical protein